MQDQDIELEWDENKRKFNIQKHEIDFVAAAHILTQFHIETSSNRKGENRRVVIGTLKTDTIVVLVYTQRGSKKRIISIRNASHEERKIYQRAKVNRPH